MTTVSFPGYARKAFTTLQRLRNGKYPEVNPVSIMQEETNRIVAYRLKGWSFASDASAVPAAGGSSRQRWRAFIHTSSHCSHAYVRVLTMPSNNTGTPVVSVTFTIAGDVAPIAYADVSVGALTDSDTPNTISVGSALTASGGMFIALDPDEDYEINVLDSDNARALAVSISEVAMQPDTDNGYIANGVVAGQDILDTHRGSMMPILRDAWTINGAPLITWASNTDATAYDAAGETNILDGSAAVTAATAGFTIDVTHRTTLRRASSGVPCIMRAYASKSSGVGSVLLKNSAGTTLATCTTSGATAAWFSSGVFYLPATLAKYDIYGKVVSGLSNTKVFAVSVYQIGD